MSNPIFIFVSPYTNTIRERNTWAYVRNFYFYTEHLVLEINLFYYDAGVDLLPTVHEYDTCMYVFVITLSLASKLCCHERERERERREEAPSSTTHIGHPASADRRRDGHTHRSSDDVFRSFVHVIRAAQLTASHFHARHLPFALSLSLLLLIRIESHTRSLLRVHLRYRTTTLPPSVISYTVQ